MLPISIPPGAPTPPPPIPPIMSCIIFCAPCGPAARSFRIISGGIAFCTHERNQLRRADKSAMADPHSLNLGWAWLSVRSQGFVACCCLHLLHRRHPDGHASFSFEAFLWTVKELTIHSVHPLAVPSRPSFLPELAVPPPLSRWSHFPGPPASLSGSSLQDSRLYRSSPSNNIRAEHLHARPTTHKYQTVRVQLIGPHCVGNEDHLLQLCSRLIFSSVHHPRRQTRYHRGDLG